MNKRKMLAYELKFYKRLAPTFCKKKKYMKYRLFANSEKYLIYKHIGGKNKIIAARGDVVCTRVNDTTILLYPNYKNTFLKYKIKLNKNTFQSLIPNSKIDVCFILPYCRKCSNGVIKDSWRLVIVTNKCQVFHNFPSRSDNPSLEGESVFLDIIHFDESVVWDLPNKKYPSENKECDKNEFFFPGFDKSSYEYHPEVNGKEKNKYGNIGFPKYKQLRDGSILSRFYFPERTTDSNPFFFLDGLEVDSKITLLGTYRSNTTHSARIVILATVDGGRSWYNKYEFSDMGEYTFRQGDVKCWGYNHGKPINGCLFKAKNPKDTWLVKRELTLNKDSPEFQRFSNPIYIKSISNTNPIRIKTETNHNLTTGNLIALCSKSNLEDANYILNNNISESCSGNGLFFKVVVVSSDEILLYENVSNVESSLPCRHIHFIDRQRDGWIVGTGETYPNGWILYISSKEGDTYSEIEIENPFEIKQLTFSEASVQRAMGLYVFERENENIIIYASDHDLLNRNISIDNNLIERNSTGVYTGKFSNINDYKQTYPLFETNEPCLFFKLFNGTFVFCGQRGLLAFGHNYGERWESILIDGPMKRMVGETFDFIVVDNYLLIKK